MRNIILFLLSVSSLYSQVPTNGLILALDASDTNSYNGSGSTWYDLSGQNAHAEALNLPSFGLNGAQIKNFDFDGTNDEFHSVNMTQEYRDLIVITKLETNSGLPMLFGHYNNKDDFPLNRLLCKDCDNDGIDNRYEFDSDNDGIGDNQDAFPCDPKEWNDLDNDGIGDNEDQDDNNDSFPDDDLIVSTVLTPNENGLESTWKAINIDKYPYTKVKVYSPDGSLVYESDNYQNDWRGENIRTGNQLPSGPYYYKIVLGESNGEIREGWVYIFN